MLLAVLLLQTAAQGFAVQPYLGLTCRIYGLVKYYHIPAATGQTDWDSLSLKAIPELIQARDNTVYNQKIGQWLQSAGIAAGTDDPLWERRWNTYPVFKNLLADTAVTLRISFDWIDNNDVLSVTNKHLLKDLLLHYQPVAHKNITLSQGVLPEHKEAGNIPRASMKEEHYLLGIFKFWNVIYYFFPYKNIADHSWDDVLEQEAATIESVRSFQQYNNELQHLSSFMNDAHVGIRDMEKKEPTNLGFPLMYGPEVIDGKVYVGRVFKDTADKAIYRIKEGDEIVAIKGQPVDSLWQAFDYYNAISNKYGKAKDFRQALWELMMDSIATDFKIRSGDSMSEVRMPAYTWERYSPVVRATTGKQDYSKAYKIINDSIGYLNVPWLQYFKFGRNWNKVKNKPYLILDCRGYGSVALFKLILRLNNTPHPVAKFDYPLTGYPGWYRTSEAEDYYAGIGPDLLQKLLLTRNPSVRKSLYLANAKVYKGKVVVLIDASALSFGETQIMAIRAYRPDATFIGSPTMGANGNVTFLYLPGNIQARYSGIDFRYADGTAIQRTGIQPDIFYEPSAAERRDNTRRNKDLLLEKALEYLRSGSASVN